MRLYLSKMSECVTDNTEVGIECTTEIDGRSVQLLDANDKVKIIDGYSHAHSMYTISIIVHGIVM